MPDIAKQQPRCNTQANNPTKSLTIWGPAASDRQAWSREMADLLAAIGWDIATDRSGNVHALCHLSLTEGRA